MFFVLVSLSIDLPGLVIFPFEILLLAASGFLLIGSKNLETNPGIFPKVVYNCTADKVCFFRNFPVTKSFSEREHKLCVTSGACERDPIYEYPVPLQDLKNHEISLLCNIMKSLIIYYHKTGINQTRLHIRIHISYESGCSLGTVLMFKTNKKPGSAVK